MRRSSWSLILLWLAFTSTVQGQMFPIPHNVNKIGESLVDTGADDTTWDTESIRVQEEFNVLWDATATTVLVRLDDPTIENGSLVYTIDTVDEQQSMLVELIVNENGIVRYSVVPMDWDRANEWRRLLFGNELAEDEFGFPSLRGGWGEFWSGYWFYLTHPAAMDDDLETGFYFAGAAGVGAGVAATAIVAAPVIAGSSITIPTIGIGTTTTAGAVGGGLVIGGTTGITTGTVTVSGSTVVAGVAGTAVLMSVDPNKLHHIFDNPDHNLGGVLNQFGNDQQAAFQAVEAATQAAVNGTGQTSGVFWNTVVYVHGVAVTVRGVVINGVVRIGTFFIP